MFLHQQHQQYHRLHVPIFSRIFSLRRYLMNGSRTPISWRQYRPVESIEKCQRPSLLDLQQPGQHNPFGEDYRIYQQNIDLDAFFGEEPKYEKVSDVCLLNDHFILVKMPPPDPSPPPSKSKIPRCFKCNRGTRVSPIREEVEKVESQPKSSCLQPWSSRDQDEIEHFDSHTRLSHAPVQIPEPEPVIVEQPHPTLQLEAIQAVAPESLRVAPVSGGPLHWFLWPFRRRLNSRSKSKPPLAAVHKTYFVRWSKPPDTLYPGFGVGRGGERKSELRRCRSAVF
ncbi:hypothetical protein KR009_006449 [Drosophila setifemur]|nr:hypothetical protein KR009_006449 [Drosophila setifemur]